jgi:hypothetical protein
MMHLHTPGVKLECEHTASGVYGTNEIAMGGDAGDNLPEASRAITTRPLGIN